MKVLKNNNIVNCPDCKSELEYTSQDLVSLGDGEATSITGIKCIICECFFTLEKTIKVIITVKLEKNPKHNPHNKLIGNCPINKNELCTDITGEHHSYLEEGTNVEDIWKKAKEKYKHITRVEYIK